MAKTVSQVALEALKIVKGLTDVRNSLVKPSAEYTEMSPDEAGNPNWLTFCPAHQDLSTPSLHVSFSDRVLFRCRAGCEQNAVLTRLKELGLWSLGPRKRVTVNNPAHEIASDELLYAQLMNERGDLPDEIYTYVNEQGQPIFWILRLNSSPKIIKPFCSVTFEDGNKGFMQIHLPSNRPVYNLAQVAHSDEVLLFEGEKTADACHKFFPNACSSTWSGGTGAVAQTNWKLLENKKVVLFPDNDEAGIKAMEKIAQVLLTRGCTVKLAFREVIKDLPKGLDLADIEDGSNIPQQWYENAIDMHPEDFIGQVSVDGALAFEDFKKRLARVSLASEVYLLDTTKKTGGIFDFTPYRSFKYGSVDCYSYEPAMIEVEGQRKPQYAIDEWIKTPENIHHGFTYNPANSEHSVLDRGKRAFNLFTGFPHTPVMGNDHEIFLELMQLMIGKHSEYLLDWLAHAIQKPAEKPGTFVLLKGPQGTGKSKIGEILYEFFGYYNAVLTTPKLIHESFNGLISAKLFVYVDEFYIGTRGNKRLLDEFKNLITANYISINEKFLPTRIEPSYHRFLSSTNDNVPYHIDFESRRDVIFNVEAHKYTKDHVFFAKFIKVMYTPAALQSLMFFLKTRKITNNIMVAPDTEARVVMFSPSDPIESFVYDLCESAEFPDVFYEYWRPGAECAEAARWPYEILYLPRSVVCEYVKDKYRLVDYTDVAITKKIISLIQDREKPDSKMSNYCRFKQIKPNGSLHEMSKNVFEFVPVRRLREIFEGHVRKKFKWNVIVNEPDSTNIIPFAARAREIKLEGEKDVL